MNISDPYNNILKSAHRHSSNHRQELLTSECCGCFYCQETFPPTNIVAWIDNDNTALCPYCGIDSVIGSQSGFDLTSDFLKEMHRYWF